MAEELYFIKTNPVIAKINLYNKLCREEDNVLHFFNNNPKSFEDIKDKIKENVEDLTKEELSTIFSWFNEYYHSDDEEVKTQLFINGIDIFYEISKTYVSNFQQILSDYENFSKQNLNYISNSESFNRFLVYGIFYTGMADKNGKSILGDFLKPDNKELYTFAENQFSLNGKDSSEKTNLIEMQSNFNELYDLTKFYKGSIIKL